MYFESEEQLFLYLKNHTTVLGSGSIGITFLNSSGKNVLKIFRSVTDDYYQDDYKKEDILRYSSIKTKNIIFPSDVIYVGNKVYGYVSRYVKGRALHEVNPLKVNLDSFVKKLEVIKKDIDVLSKNNIVMYDSLYNILLGRNFYVIDTDEYSLGYNAIDENNCAFSSAIMLFLVDNYFNDFVNSDVLLSSMYQDFKVDPIQFLKELRYKLSTFTGKEITCLEMAKKCLNKEVYEPAYIRSLI